MAQTPRQFPHEKRIVEATRSVWLTDSAALLNQCQMQVFRGSGPGGQKRNKTSSGVRLVHLPSGCTSVATERRSQKQNLAAAIERLRLEIAIEVRTDRPVDELAPVGANHVQFPSCAANLLDALAQNGWSVRDTAAACSTSTGQITRLICAEPRILAKVNQERLAVGLRALRDRI